MMASLTSSDVSPTKCAELVRTNDTGTLQYEMYFNRDNTECLVFERYRDSQALLDLIRIWGTQWLRSFGHARGLEKYAERPALN